MIVVVKEYDTSEDLQIAIDEFYQTHNVLHIECLSHNSKLVLVLVIRNYAG